MDSKSITIEPVVSYPRTARPGERHYLTVDVQHRHPPEQWPYEQEELALTCLVHTPLFTHEPLGDQSIVLHRYGGSYGPAAFLLTAREPLQKGAITLSFVNRHGMTVHTVVLPNIEITAQPSDTELPTTSILLSQEGGEVVEDFLPPAESPDAPDDWVSFSGEVSEFDIQLMKDALEGFRQYLVRNGVVEEPIQPSAVHVYLHGEGRALFDPMRSEIHLHGLMERRELFLLRHYAQHILMMGRTGGGALIEDVMLGLADYLACSFKNDPALFAKKEESENSEGISQQGLNSRPVFQRAQSPSIEAMGRIWGGAFWELRQHFGAQVTDQLVVQAWRADDPHFSRALLRRMGRRSFEKFEKTSEVLLARGLLEDGEQRDLLVEAIQPVELSLPPITIPRPEVDHLAKLLTDPDGPPIIRLEGYYGQGSATILRMVGLRLEQLAAPDDFLLFDVPSRLPKRFSPEAFFEIFTSRIEHVLRGRERSEQRPVVCIGNFHRLHVLGASLPFTPKRLPSTLATMFTGRLRDMLMQFHARVVLACRPDTPQVHGAHVIRIQDMDAAQIQHLSKLFGVTLSDEGVQELLHWTGGSFHLAEIALQGAHQKKWPLEDLMRFEGEEWLRIFDAEMDRVRAWIEHSGERHPRRTRSLHTLGEGVSIYLDDDLALPLMGQGVLRASGDGEYTLRSPFYKRVFHPEAVARLPPYFRDRVDSHQWSLALKFIERERRHGLRLVLYSHEPKKDPLPGLVRFRLTPDIEKTVKPRSGKAVAEWFLPALGPTTAYAELEGGRYRLSMPIDGFSPPPERESRNPIKKIRKKAAKKLKTSRSKKATRK